MTKSIAARDAILSRIDTTGECWTWAGTMDNHGYGRIRINGKQHKAHRLAYEEFVGPIPAGLEIDHLCRNRACVNPKHLEAVTHAENMARVPWPTLDYCRRGHDLSLPNARRSPRGECRLCHNLRGREAKRRQRVKARASHD